MRMSRRRTRLSPTRRRTPTRASAHPLAPRWWSASSAPTSTPSATNTSLSTSTPSRVAFARTTANVFSSSAGRFATSSSGACRATSTSSPTPAGARSKTARQAVRAVVGETIPESRTVSRDDARARGREMYELVSMQEHDRVRRMRAEALGETEDISEDAISEDELEEDETDETDDSDGVAPNADANPKTVRSNTAPRSYYASDRWIARLRGNAMERDFTVNALAYDVGSRTAYDFVGVDGRRGRADGSRGDGPRAKFPRRSREDASRGSRGVSSRVSPRGERRARDSFRRARDQTSPLRPRRRRAPDAPRHRTRRAERSRAWELGLLEHVMHAHATYVARAR